MDREGTLNYASYHFLKKFKKQRKREIHHECPRKKFKRASAGRTVKHT